MLLKLRAALVEGRSGFEPKGTGLNHPTVTLFHRERDRIAARTSNNARPGAIATAFSSELTQRPAGRFKPAEKIRHRSHIWPCAMTDEPLSSAPRR
ncbi:hypothetical protein [Hoeflea sp. 108]|uniref:hypothetical protein n=1 Tax=Hoeflea sp. 108 TaxID=1116369 RepID=UPI0012FAA397|nr:hypothetical protein [Hoeflea sp. 108]